MASLEGWGSTIELHPRGGTSRCYREVGLGQYGPMPTAPGANQAGSDSRWRHGVGDASLLVRAPLRSDARRLAEVNVETWRRAYDGIVSARYLEAFDVEAARRGWLGRIIEPGDRVCFVAEVAGAVAAYAVGGPYRTQQDAEPEDTTGWGSSTRSMLIRTCRTEAPALPCTNAFSTHSRHEASPLLRSGCCATTFGQSGGTANVAGGRTGRSASGSGLVTHWRSIASLAALATGRASHSNVR